MLAELKFVMGAVAKKDFVPALTHFVIENGTVRGYNGTLALCSPIALDIACKPKAVSLVAAIAGCADTVQLTLTPTGRLSVRSGPFKALVECIQDTPLHVEPEGERVELDGAALLAAIKAVMPFVGDDASRPWSNGMLLRGQSAFATNNVMLVEYWIGTAFPHVVNIPRAALKEMIRINEPPLYAQMVPGSNVTFHYSGDRWVRTQLLDVDAWPDLARVLNVESVQQPLQPSLFEGLKTLKPFIDKMGRVYFKDGQICTHVNTDDGDTYDVPGQHHEGIYSHEMLSLLSTASTIDFTLYPKPCIFMGQNMRGAIVGMRQ